MQESQDFTSPVSPPDISTSESTENIYDTHTDPLGNFFYQTNISLNKNTKRMQKDEIREIKIMLSCHAPAIICMALFILSLILFTISVILFPEVAILITGIAVCATLIGCIVTRVCGCIAQDCCLPLKETELSETAECENHTDEQDINPNYDQSNTENIDISEENNSTEAQSVYPDISPDIQDKLMLIEYCPAQEGSINIYSNHITDHSKHNTIHQTYIL